MCSSSDQQTTSQHNGDIESNYPVSSDKTKLSSKRSLTPAFICRLCLTVLRIGLLVSIVGAAVFVTAYYMGLTFVVQLAIVALVAYLAAGGGYRWFYIAFKTFRRDTTALLRYILFLISVRRLSKNNMCIGKIFRENAKKNPNKVCFVFEDKEWTLGEVEEYSNKIANLFKSHGYRKGDAVGLMLENRPEFVCLWLGLSKIGVIAALINHNLRQTSLLHSINVAKCQALIFGDDFTDAVSEISNQLGGVRFYSFPGQKSGVKGDLGDRPLGKLLEETNSSPPNLDDIGFHDRLLYIYTSGTTGLPKAAVITHSRYVFLAGAISYQIGFKRSDRFYSPLPLYHTAGGAMSAGQAVVYGACVVIKRKFSASSYFSDIVKYNCTITQYIGEMCRYILATPPKSTDTQHKIRIIFGNGLRPQIWKEFVERFKIPRVAEFYGATEGNANIVNVDNTFGAIGFVSRIVPSVYPISVIKVDAYSGEPVRDANGLCIRCQPGEPGVFIGKIIPSNPARAFLGYVNEKESEKKIVRDVFAKGDSAFLSGDIIVFDEFGYLFFKDRTGDTFRWKGENVSTSEVEGIVSNLVGFKDCVVYGVEVPGSEGRAGMAAIVDKDNSINFSKLADGLKKALPPYARPIFLRILHEVEMTGTYKMKKLDLQKEGFDPSVIKDNLYYADSNGSYSLLTPDIYSNIQNGKIRL